VKECREIPFSEHKPLGWISHQVNIIFEIAHYGGSGRNRTILAEFLVGHDRRTDMHACPVANLRIAPEEAIALDHAKPTNTNIMPDVAIRENDRKITDFDIAGNARPDVDKTPHADLGRRRNISPFRYKADERAALVQDLLGIDLSPMRIAQSAEENIVFLGVVTFNGTEDRWITSRWARQAVQCIRLVIKKTLDVIHTVLKVRLSEGDLIDFATESPCPDDNEMLHFRHLSTIFTMASTELTLSFVRE